MTSIPAASYNLIDTEDPRELRYARRNWDSIIQTLQTLLRNAKPDTRFTAVCRNGMHVRVAYSQADLDYGHIDDMTVRVPTDAPPDIIAVLAHDSDKSPARGMFRAVPTHTLVDILWRCGGVDLAASRRENNTSC